MLVHNLEMLWDAIGYESLSSNFRTDGTLNCGRYISIVLRPVALTFSQALRNSMFQLDRPHVVSNFRTFLNTEIVRPLPWLAHSPYFSPTENVWSMVVERLSRHRTPVTTVDELWHLVEAPGTAVQS